MATKICIFSIALFIISSCKVNQQNLLDKFKGMWKLDKYEAFDPTSGKWHDAPNRIGYSGYILYDGIGHMAVQLLPPQFKEVVTNKPIDSLNAEELRKILKLHSASFTYFANCDITQDSSLIKHHRLSSNNPKEWGTTIKRSFEFKGDTLVLTANELIEGLKLRLRWVKI